mgnify:CR=1 FL=1
MAKNTAVATRPVRPIDSFKIQLRAALPTVMRMLPDHVRPEEFEARVVTAVANKPELLECDSKSLLQACAEAAELGLSLNPHLGEGYILKVWDKKLNNGKGGYGAQFRAGFIGLMKLARQSGEVRKIEAHVRHKNDYWKMVRGLSPDLQHEPHDGDRGEPVGAYCWWELNDGVKQFEYMDADAIEKIKQRSSSKNKDGDVVGPWISDPEEMWRKTVVRRSRKYMPQSPQMAKFHEAVARDNEVEFDDEKTSYVDVTDSPPPAAAGAPQVDKLADKLAPVLGTAIERLEPPVDFDGKPDYFAWHKLAEPLVLKMDKAARGAWFKAHADIVKAAPQEVAEWAAS